MGGPAPNTCQAIPNQKIEEEKELFTELKQLRNPGLRLELTKLISSTSSEIASAESAAGGKALD